MKLNDQQIDEMLKDAQRLQNVGFLHPEYMAIIDPKTDKLSLSLIEYPEPNVEEVHQSQEQIVASSIVDAVTEALPDSINIYDREVERSIQDIANKLVESIVLSGVDVDTDDFAKAVAVGLKNYSEEALIYMADKMRDADVSSLATYFGDCSPDHVIRVMSQGPEWLLADLKQLYENPGEGGLEDVGPNVDSIEGNDDLDGLRQRAQEMLDSIEESGFLDVVEPDKQDDLVEAAYERDEASSLAQAFNELSSVDGVISDQIDSTMEDVGGSRVIPASELHVEESAPDYSNDM